MNMQLFPTSLEKDVVYFICIVKLSIILWFYVVFVFLFLFLLYFIVLTMCKWHGFALVIRSMNHSYF